MCGIAFKGAQEQRRLGDLSSLCARCKLPKHRGPGKPAPSREHVTGSGGLPQPPGTSGNTSAASSIQGDSGASSADERVGKDHKVTRLTKAEVEQLQKHKPQN